MLEGHDYPFAVASLLGEALAATCLLTATLKFEGEITLQIQGSGPLTMLVINGRNNQTMRGIARTNGDVDRETSFRQLIEQGHMVITIAPDEGERYQGIVALDSDTLSSCIEQYFNRSEQLPTKVTLFSDAHDGHSGGLLLQTLPGKHKQQQHDLEHLGLLVETLTAKELFDLDANQILYRLFHQEEVHIFEPQAVAFKCSCSRERSQGALIAMGQEEIGKLFTQQEVIDMHCQYCGVHHIFTFADLEELFNPAGDTQH